MEFAERLTGNQRLIIKSLSLSWNPLSKATIYKDISRLIRSYFISVFSNNFVQAFYEKLYGTKGCYEYDAKYSKSKGVIKAA